MYQSWSWIHLKNCSQQKCGILERAVRLTTPQETKKKKKAQHVRRFDSPRGEKAKTAGEGENLYLDLKKCYGVLIAL